MQARIALQPVLTLLLLASAVPILLYVAMGLSTEASNFSFAAGLVYGLILAGVTLTATGRVYSRRIFAAVGAGLLFGASIPLLRDGFFIFALLPATMSLILISVKSTKGELEILG
jgi:hypothetical protein